MAQPALVLTEVGKSYQLGPLEIEVLRGVNLRVEAGERLTIQGRTGSGKTTLLNILGLLDAPSRGSYLLAGEDTRGADDETRSDLRNSHLGFVFQAYHLIPYLSAVENVALPLEYRSDAPGSAERRAREVLDRVGLSNRARHRPDELSGGERQRVAVARAVVGRPSLLLADEPTAALDADSRDELLDLLVTLNREDGLTLVLMTHDDAVAARGTRRVRLHEGALLEAPAP